jgi:preprotein translocase subunit SecG
MRPAPMVALLVSLHILVSVFLIFVILLQPGKGDGMGAMGGGGGTASAVFGGQGSVTFLAKVTQVCAVIFMITSLTLAYRSSHSASVMSARRAMAAEDAAKAKGTDAAKTDAPKSDATPAPTAPAAPAVAPSAPAAPAPAPAAPAK